MSYQLIVNFSLKLTLNKRKNNVCVLYVYISAVPTISADLGELSVDRGNNVSLICTVQGDTDIDVFWTHPITGVQLNSSSSLLITTSRRSHILQVRFVSTFKEVGSGCFV